MKYLNSFDTDYTMLRLIRASALFLPVLLTLLVTSCGTPDYASVKNTDPASRAVINLVDPKGAYTHYVGRIQELDGVAYKMGGFQKDIALAPGHHTIVFATDNLPGWTGYESKYDRTIEVNLLPGHKYQFRVTVQKNADKSRSIFTRIEDTKTGEVFKERGDAPADAIRLLQ